MTPQLVEGMLDGTIKGVLNIGEDLTHIHPNINKLVKAFDNLELIFVQALFMTDIAERADIVVGVKSAYKKTGIYINAMRKAHLSTPLVHSDLPDDWEVLKQLDEKISGKMYEKRLPIDLPVHHMMCFEKMKNREFLGRLLKMEMVLQSFIEKTLDQKMELVHLDIMDINLLE